MATTRPARRRSSSETRDHVLRVAQELFYWEGIHAVGVDRIAAAAEVAPTTLYRLFASKDELIAAYVLRLQEDYRAWFTAAGRDDGRDARDRILSVFDELAAQTRPDRSRGCPFLMTLAEFPDTAAPCHLPAVDLKLWVRARFAELVAELARTRTIHDPSRLADQLTLIMEGVYATIQALGPDGPARQARSLVEAILPD